jgi:hypothetical protein
MSNTTLEPRQAEILTHMLGAGPHVKKELHGYRNGYCAVVDSPDYATLLAMKEAGLVEAGRFVNHQCKCQYFYATLAGCIAIGLGAPAVKRAMND